MPPPMYIRGWKTFDDARITSSDGKALHGTAASNGVISGIARVCLGLDEVGKVKKGDILVAHATDPAWTTLYSIVGGVVVETGGVVSHAVMISREYGIPCVSNLPGACSVIPDGARITVNGSDGIVILEDA